MNNFFLDGTSSDPLYRQLRDDSGTIVFEAREFTNDLWKCTSDYVDLDIKTSARDQFHSRFWEMYLIATLRKRGFPVVKREFRRFKSKGPDIQVGNVITWFEAIAVIAGNGPDAVPEINQRSKVAPDVSQSKIMLRLTAGLQVKNDQYRKYRHDNIIKENEPFIIALNAALIPHLHHALDLHIPWIVKSVFLIGHEVLQLKKGKVVGNYHQFQDAIVKENGTPIEKNFFEQPESKGVSAVLYSTANVSGYRDLGNDFILVHNPNARAPIPRGFLPFGSEYWLENNDLICKIHTE